MPTPALLRAAPVAACLIALANPVQAFVYSSGAGVFEVAYSGGQLVSTWELQAGAVVDGSPLAANASFNPASIVVFTDDPFTPRPFGAYDFIGVPVGTPIWDIPQVNTPGEPFVAIGAPTLNPADWSSFSLSLVSVSGPPGADFSVYLDTTSPIVRFATADGITAADSFTPVLGGHAHQTFAFTQHGLYQALVQWDGVHVVDGPKSGQATLTFGVAVVPEPATSAGLMALAGAAAAIVRRRRA